MINPHQPTHPTASSSVLPAAPLGKADQTVTGLGKNIQDSNPTNLLPEPQTDSHSQAKPATERKITVPETLASPTPIAPLKLEKAATIVHSRLQELSAAMETSGLPASQHALTSIESALNEAKTTGHIRALNQLWKETHKYVVNIQTNPSAKALLEGLNGQDRPQVMDALKAGINGVDLHNDPDLRDLFLIDLIAHFMTIAVYIELLGQAGVFDPMKTDDLYQALKQHDQTKVFEPDSTTVNTDNMKGYMLLPLVFGVLAKQTALTDHKIIIPVEVKTGGALSNTCIAAPILSHVSTESHHPEYHIQKNQPMAELDIAEFMADGLAAGSRPDRFSRGARFSETLPRSQSFWLQRLGKEEGKMPTLWSSLHNVDEVASEVKQGISGLLLTTGDVKLEHYFGQPV